jgi:hypothetical protein
LRGCFNNQTAAQVTSGACADFDRQRHREIAIIGLQPIAAMLGIRDLGSGDQVAVAGQYRQPPMASLAGSVCEALQTENAPL